MTSQQPKPLTWTDYAVLVLFFISAFVQSVIIAFLGPLFPPEAESKGLTPYQYGLVNGVSSLVGMFFSPVVGHYLDAIGLQKVFVWCTLFNGIVPITIGLIDFSPNFAVYVALTVFIRLMMGALNVGIVSSKYSLCFSGFPGRPSTAVGISESGFLLGTSIGPIIGTALATPFGFTAAFVIIGVAQIILGAVLILFLPKIDVAKSPRLTASQTVNAYWTLLKHKSMVVFMLGMVLAEMGFSYANTILEPGLRIFNLTENQVGLMFLAKGFCQILAPFWGFVLDNVAIPHAFYASGYLIAALGIGIFSPLPFITATSTLAAIGLLIYGTGQGILDIACICCFQLEFLALENKTKTKRMRHRTGSISHQFGHLYIDTQSGMVDEGQEVNDLESAKVKQQGRSHAVTDLGSTKIKDQGQGHEVIGPEDPEMKQSMVTIVYLIASSLGNFAGAGVSGLLLQLFGFSDAMLFLGGIFCIFGIFLLIFICLRALSEFSSFKEYSSDSNEVTPLLIPNVDKLT